MRILFLDQFAALGGAQRCLLELMPAMLEAGWQPHVALPCEGPLTEKLRALNVPVHALPLGAYAQGRKGLRDAARFVWDLHAGAEALRILAGRVSPCVLYVNGPRWMPAVAWAGLRLPVVFHAHSLVNARNGKLLVSAALRRTGATVIAASQCAASAWSRAARVIYGGVEGPAAGFSRAASTGGPRIGLIGRFAPQKCQREFIAAAAALRAEIPAAVFYLCGDAVFGDPATVRYKAGILAHAPPNVHHVGWRDDVYAALAELDLLVAPSVAEGGIPLVVLQAFAAGVPVLASAVGDTGKVIEEGRTGFLLHSHRAAEIAARLREVLANRQRLPAVAAAARELWRERFTVERYRREILDAIDAAVLPPVHSRALEIL